MSDVIDQYKCEVQVSRVPKAGRRVTKSRATLQGDETDATVSKYFSNPSSTSKFASAALRTGFKQTESNLPEPEDISDLVEPPPEPTAREWIDSLMTDQLRFECYLGNCAPLMKHARENYGTAGQGGMSTTQVRNWLKRNPEHIPAALRDIKWHIDHVVPESLNPVANWPSNYFIMSTKVNLYFGKYITKEKIAYVGKSHFQMASEFCRWCGLKSKAYIEYKQHDAVTDHFLVQRSR